MDKKGKSIIVYFLYAIFIVVIIASAAMIWPVYRKHRRIKDYVSNLKEELKNKTDEAVKLNKQVHDLDNNPEAVEKIAREKFGLVKPGETVLIYDDQNKNSGRRDSQ